MNIVHGRWGRSDQHNPVLAFGSMAWHGTCRRGGRTVLPDRQHETSQYSDKTRLVQHFGYDAEDVEHMAERYLDEDLPGAVQVSPQAVVRPRYIPVHCLVLHVHMFKLLSCKLQCVHKVRSPFRGVDDLPLNLSPVYIAAYFHHPNPGIPLCQ